MKLSKFGQKFTSNSGILQLMDDLGSALSSERKMIMLGGGNPARIPQVEARFRDRMGRILDSEGDFEQLVSVYGAPHGHQEFAKAMAAMLRKNYGWDIHAGNIVLTNGSQTAFFYIFNMFAGEFHDGTRKKILLPLAPEYIGYLDVGLTNDFFTASKPEFEYFDDHLFKYRVDFNAVSITNEVGAICVSRPTNPTGNVLTDDEIERLHALARTHDIPFIIDNAYGTPFPNIIFTEARPVWDDNIILCMSLSKLGLPGVRTGIIIANEQITRAITGLNAIVSLAPGSFGATLALDMVKTGQIISMSRDVIRPYYQRKGEQAINYLRQEMQGLDFYIHKPEGAFFLWLWFKGLPITSQTFYERLKERGVIAVPGEYFFPGIREAWPHKFECLRMNYAGDETLLKEGIKIIADEAKRAYAE